MDKLKGLNVLITAAGNVYMPGTIKCLKNNGEREIRVVGADINDDSSILNMCDACYVVPPGDSPDYVDKLFDICIKESIDIILPIMSAELEALSTEKSKFFNIGTTVSVSDIDKLRIANDKLKLFDFMKNEGLLCADYISVDSIEELIEGANKLGYGEKKVCLKANHASGSRGFRILDNSQNKFKRFISEKPTSATVTLEEMVQILQTTNSFPSLMLMEYLPGAEYTVDLVAKDGKVRFCGCRKSLRMDNSIMLDSVVVDNKAVSDNCIAVTEKLGLSGNIGFDVRERADGTPIIMECNPRITAGIPVFNIAGMNLPYLNIKCLLGESVDEVSLSYGTVVRRRWQEMQG